MDLRKVTTSRSGKKPSQWLISNNNSFCYTLLLVLLGFNLVLQVANAQRVYYHSECGESPVVKYKELAKSIGNLLRPRKLKLSNKKALPSGKC